MFGYSRQTDLVFILNKNYTSKTIKPKVEVENIFVPLKHLSFKQWMQLKKLQGPIKVLYVRCRYGSAKTYISLGYVGEKLAHVEWIVPAEKIRGRYPFVTEGSYSIISCVTSECFRGMGIYPSQIQKVVSSDIPSKVFWIWAHSTNISSLKGIYKAGGVKVAELVQERWLWGFFSSIKYFPVENSKQAK